jgi:alpha-tubulin suppressor-like RCC1 family protein
VHVGEWFACALTPGGAAYCWGTNGLGELGDGSNATQRVPVAVAGGLTFSAIDVADAHHTCGLTTSGVAYCWGSNQSGQLGDGTVTNRNVPVKVLGQP